MANLATWVKKGLGGLMDKLMPRCDVVSRMISDSLDRPLPLWDRLKIRLHLMFCRFCTRYRRQLVAMRDMFENNRQMEEASQATDQPGLSDSARERIKQSLLPPEER